ncbi:hypothetical protein [Anaerosporobacter sp.]|uniref:hypothetical protein n=1 Tax=Anaerosporobacter sp. TaxID=1872529 RepID=UPI00286ECC40|nr:hypothetical protein [Anaerosporobacter sp.]
MNSRMKRYSLLVCSMMLLLLTGCNMFVRTESHTYAEKSVGISSNLVYNYPIVFQNDSKNIQIRVSYGLNAYAKVGKDMCVKIGIYTGGTVFEGSVQIEVPYDNTTTKYNQEVTMNSNSYAEYTMEIPVIYENMQFSIHLLDKEENIQASQETMVQASRIFNVQYIGILDKQMQAEAVVSRGKVQVFQLYSDKLEDGFDNLDLLDCILLDEEEIDQLKDTEVLKMKEWLQNGGTLLLESTSKASADREDIYEKIAMTIGNDGAYGFGRCIRVSKMSTINELVDYVDNLGLNPKLFLSRNVGNQVKESVYADIVKKVPDITKYMIVFLLYIILIGPVLYGILKIKKQRVWYFRIVPIISAIFVIVIYGLGRDSRVESSYLRYVTITQIAQDGYTKDTTCLAVVNPTKGEVVVQTDVEDNLQPLYTQSDNYQFTSEKTHVNMEFTTSVENSTSEENMKISSVTCTIPDIRAFQPVYLKIAKSYLPTTQREEMQSIGPIICDNYRITGSVTNTMGMDLSNVCIVSNQTIVEIGDWVSGEEVQLENCQYGYIPSYDFLYTDTVDARVKNLTKSTDKVEESSTYNLMQYVLNEWLTQNPDGSYLLAFAKDSENDSVLSSSGISQVDSSAHMIIMELSVNYGNGNGEVFQPTIKPYMSIVSGEYYQELDMIESDSLIVDYDFGREVIKQIEYSPYYNTEFYIDDTNKEAIWFGFYGTVYFYNRRTREYEKVITSGEVATINQLSDYLGDCNVLRVRYEVSQDSLNSNLITMPKLTAIKE